MLLRADCEAEGRECQGILLEVADIPVKCCAFWENVSMQNVRNERWGAPACIQPKIFVLGAVQT